MSSVLLVICSTWSVHIGCRGLPWLFPLIEYSNTKSSCATFPRVEQNQKHILFISIAQFFSTSFMLLNVYDQLFYLFCYPRSNVQTWTNHLGLLWTAPELLPQDDGDYPAGTFKGDVYSFAIICQELICRKGPFFIDDEQQPEAKVCVPFLLVRCSDPIYLCLLDRILHLCASWTSLCMEGYA